MELPAWEDNYCGCVGLVCHGRKEGERVYTDIIIVALVLVVAKEKRNNQWLLYYSGENFAGACLFFLFFLDILILPKILRFFLFSLDYASCYNGNCNDAA